MLLLLPLGAALASVAYGSLDRTEQSIRDILDSVSGPNRRVVLRQEPPVTIMAQPRPSVIDRPVFVSTRQDDRSSDAAKSSLERFSKLIDKKLDRLMERSRSAARKPRSHRPAKDPRSKSSLAGLKAAVKSLKKQVDRLKARPKKKAPRPSHRSAGKRKRPSAARKPRPNSRKGEKLDDELWKKEWRKKQLDSLLKKLTRQIRESRQDLQRIRDQIGQSQREAQQLQDTINQRRQDPSRQPPYGQQPPPYSPQYPQPYSPQQQPWGQQQPRQW